MIPANHLEGRDYLHDIEHEIGALAALAERLAGTPAGLEARRDLASIVKLLASRAAV